jgi:hypothetical protein
LDATILYDGHLKPFSILTDDNAEISSVANRDFIVKGYRWDLKNGTYDVHAEETYIEDEVIEVEGADPLTAPTITGASQYAPGSFMYIEWSTVEGATGYKLQRIPTWYTQTDTPYWAMFWSTIYMGANNFCNDYIQDEGNAYDGLEIRYRVCAYVDSGFQYENGPYSAEAETNWYEA